MKLRKIFSVILVLTMLLGMVLPVTTALADLNYSQADWDYMTTPPKKCSVCGHKLSRDDSDVGIETFPTCTKSGKAHYYCNNCIDNSNYDGIDFTLKALGHDWGKDEILKKPTCTKEGKGSHTCKRCGETETFTIEKADHDWGKWEIVEEPTCAKEGLRTHTCKVCGKEKTGSIKKTDHTFGEWYIAQEALDGQVGIRERDCTVCGYAETEEFYIEGTLKQGDRGDPVKELQQLLNASGYDCGKADGIYGKKTADAVTAWELEHGKPGDGIAWPSVLAGLKTGELPGDPPTGFEEGAKLELYINIKSGEKEEYEAGDTVYFRSYLNNLGTVPFTTQVIVFGSQKADDIMSDNFAEYRKETLGSIETWIFDDDKNSYTFTEADAARGYAYLHWYAIGYQNDEDAAVNVNGTEASVYLTLPVKRGDDGDDDYMMSRIELFGTTRGEGSDFRIFDTIEDPIAVGESFDVILHAVNDAETTLNDLIFYGFLWTDDDILDRDVKVFTTEPGFTLAPGESIDVPFTYIVTEADAEDGVESIAFLADATDLEYGDYVGSHEYSVDFTIGEGDGGQQEIYSELVLEATHKYGSSAHHVIAECGVTNHSDCSVRDVRILCAQLDAWGNVLREDTVMNYMQDVISGGAFWMDVDILDFETDCESLRFVAYGYRKDNGDLVVSNEAEIPREWEEGGVEEDPGDGWILPKLEVYQFSPAQAYYTDGQTIAFEYTLSNPGILGYYGDDMMVYYDNSKTPDTNPGEFVCDVDATVYYDDSADVDYCSSGIFTLTLDSSKASSDGMQHLNFYVAGCPDWDTDWYSATNAVSFSFAFEEAWHPDIWLEKGVVGHSKYAEGYEYGEDVEYSLTLFNLSEETLTNVEIWDKLYSDADDEPVAAVAEIEPHSTYVAIFHHQVTLEEVDAACIINQACATFGKGEDDVGYCWSNTVTVPTIPSDDDTEYNEYFDALTVIKTVGSTTPMYENGEYYAPGDTIKFVIRVENNTDTAFTDVVVYDPLYTGGALASFEKIDAHDFRRIEFSYDVSMADAWMGCVSNTACVTGKDPNNDSHFSTSNTVDVPTGFLPHVGYPEEMVYMAKYEVSTPNNFEYYTLGETIYYIVDVINCGSVTVDYADVIDFNYVDLPQQIGTLSEFYPGMTHSFEYSHVVNEEDVARGIVINSAWADCSLGSYLRTYYSNAVFSPTGGEGGSTGTHEGLTGGLVAEAKGDACELILESADDIASVYVFKPCEEHGAIAEKVQSKLAAAQTEEETLAALAEGQQLWTDAIFDIYRDCYAKAKPEEVMTTVRDEAAFLNMIAAYRQSMLQLYPEDPVQAETAVLEVLEKFCKNMCGETRIAPAMHRDSILRGGRVPLDCDDYLLAYCGVDVKEESTETERAFRVMVYPCMEHRETNMLTRELLKMQDNDEQKTAVFAYMRVLWQMELSERMTALLTAQPENTSGIVAANTAFANWLNAHDAFLNVLYPEDALWISEQLSTLAAARVVEGCGDVPEED